MTEYNLKKDDHFDTIREVWDVLTDIPDYLYWAIDQLEPKGGEQENHCARVREFASKIEHLTQKEYWDDYLDIAG